MDRFTRYCSLFFFLLNAHCHAIDVGVSADLLWWRSCPDLSFFLVQEQNVIQEGPDAQGIISLRDAKNLNRFLKGKFCPGVRAALHVGNFPQCNLDFSVSGTYFSSRKKRKFKSDGTTVLSPSFVLLGTTFTDPPSSINLGSRIVTGIWDVDLSVVNIALSTPLEFGCSVNYSPHLSLQYVWLCNDDITKTKGVLGEGFPSGFNNPFVSNFEEGFTTKRRFRGIGPRFGWNIDWDVGCGLGIYNNAAMAFVYQSNHFKSVGKARRFNSVNPLNDTDNIVNIFKEERVHATFVNTEIALGLYWKYEFCGCMSTLKAGWEHHQFYHVDGEISFQGLTISASLDY